MLNNPTLGIDFFFNCFYLFSFYGFIKKIAEVVEASLEDYEQGMKACREASRVWMQVIFFIYNLDCSLGIVAGVIIVKGLMLSLIVFCFISVGPCSKER